LSNRRLQFSTLKGNIQGTEVNIVISLDYNANYMNIDLANQLLIPEPNIIGKEDYFQIKELQVTINEYEYISQFYVTTMYQEEVDIIIGLPWFKSLGTFILNMEKKFVTFPYKEKMITLQDTTSELDSVTLEDFNNISEVILQENKKAMQRTQKEFDEVITEKNEEISRLKDHNKKLLGQIKKAKVTKQYGKKIEQGKEDLEKELKKNLTEKEEENSRLKNLNQLLLEQIRKLKEEKLENPDIKDIDKSGHEESTTQEVTKSTRKKTTSDVEVQTMEAPNKLTNQNSAINKATSAHEENHISKSKEENATSMIKGNHVMRTPYQHSNHKSIYINQLEYQYYPRREPYKHPISQKIELGWADSFTIRRFCSALRHSYHLVSSTTTTPRTVDERTLQVKEKVIKPFINML
jgi:hypothetical protein